MKKIIAVVLALSLAGCATFERIKNTADAIGEFNVSPEAVIIASNTFDAAEVTATNYLRLKRCKRISPAPLCRNPTATALIIPAIRSGRVARDNLQQFLKDHCKPDILDGKLNCSQLAPASAYEKLDAVINTLKSVYSQYGAV